MPPPVAERGAGDAVRPCWDPDLVRDDVRDYVVEHLGDPQGVLIGDDTGS
jgi:hypothetical protein